MRLPRPGRRASQVATGTGVSAGSLVALAAAGYGVIRAEATLARRAIGEPKDEPPDPTGVYGRYLGPSLRLVMLGDSSATGLGCDSPGQTRGALRAGCSADRTASCSRARHGRKTSWPPGSCP